MNNFVNTLTVILVIYNRALEDSESFSSVCQMVVGGSSLDVFVYDNSSHPQQIKDYANLQITYVHDPKNSGVSKAYNAGAAHAREQQKKWVLLLDQDTTLPATILDDYGKAVCQNLEINLFVPILRLANGKIFSPCTYKYKRGFYSDYLNMGVNSLQQLSPVNSGILVNLTAFFDAGGYNERIKLDFSDFQFIERFRKHHANFYILDVECKQDFSDDEISFSGQAVRFQHYCDGARNIEKEGFWDLIQYDIVVFLRAIRLTMRYRHIGFLKTYLNTFLFPRN